MTNIEKLKKMRKSAVELDSYVPMLRASGLSEEQIALAIEGYDEGMCLLDAAIESYELMQKLGKFEQMRRNGVGLMTEEREERATLQRKIDDFAVKIFKAG